MKHSSMYLEKGRGYPMQSLTERQYRDMLAQEHKEHGIDPQRSARLIDVIVGLFEFAPPAHQDLLGGEQDLQRQ